MEACHRFAEKRIYSALGLLAVAAVLSVPSGLEVPASWESVLVDQHTDEHWDGLAEEELASYCADESNVGAAILAAEQAMAEAGMAEQDNVAVEEAGTARKTDQQSVHI